MSINFSVSSMNLNNIDDWLSKPATAIDIPKYGLGVPKIRWDRYDYSATLHELSTLIFNAYDKELNALENQPLSISQREITLLKQIESGDELVNKFRKIESKVNQYWMKSSLGKMGMFFHKAQNVNAGDELSTAISELAEISKEKIKIAKKIEQEKAKKLAEENAKRQENIHARTKTQTHSKTQNNPFFMFDEFFEMLRQAESARFKQSEFASSGMFGVKINGQKFWMPNGTTEFVFNGIHYKTKSNDHDYLSVPPVTHQYNPYEVMGLSKNATQQQIKKQYHKLALQRHPDKNLDDPQATVKFQLLTQAYNLLNDPKKRQDYDRFGVIR